ncbi:hypothetical protein PTTG_09991, partial [Puccinia triticina 1-1 BBBD Race 1]
MATDFPPILGFKVPVPTQTNIPRTRDFDKMTVGSYHLGAPVIFNDAAIPTSDDLGFTPFFERNLLAFRAPLPLTIFNEVWQDRALAHQAEKRVKSDSGDKDRYSGYPYPCKYTQTYQEWSINHQGFYDAVAKIPNHANLAIWLITHKRNADRIIKREGFMKALRYDIQVRTNALTHRVTMPDGSLSVANISIYWKEVVLTQHAKVVQFGEASSKITRMQEEDAGLDGIRSLANQQ